MRKLIDREIHTLNQKSVAFVEKKTDNIEE